MKITGSLGGNNDNNNDANDEIAALSLPARHVEPRVDAGFCVTTMKEWVQVQEAAFDFGSANVWKVLAADYSNAALFTSHWEFTTTRNLQSPSLLLFLLHFEATWKSNLFLVFFFIVFKNFGY